MSDGEEALEKLTEELTIAAADAMASKIKDCKNEPSEKCAAVLQASMVAAMRIAVSMGCPWQEAIWGMRGMLSHLEEAHVEALREQMIAKVGAPTAAEVASATGTAESQVGKPLIEVATTYTPKSE